LRCPWHHARFSLQTGVALRAPALSPNQCWEVERRGDMVFAGRRRALLDGASALPGQAAPTGAPAAVIIIGAGAAGNAAAETLRRCAYEALITRIGAEPDLSYDRSEPFEGLPGWRRTGRMNSVSRSRIFRAACHYVVVWSKCHEHRFHQAASRPRYGGTRDFGQLLIATGAESSRQARRWQRHLLRRPTPAPHQRNISELAQRALRATAPSRSGGSE
jgi:hypothetical protein